MSDAGDARHAILGAIRERLQASAVYERTHAALHDVPRPAARVGGANGKALPVLGDVKFPVGGAIDAQPAATVAPLDRFREQAMAVGAACEVATDEAAARAAVARILAAAGARTVACSDATLARAVLAGADPGTVVRDVDTLTRDQLFACDAGVTTAQWGIAETGTLVLESARERHRLLSLVPPLHVALLSTRRIRATLGDVLARVGPDGAGRRVESHAITFITGPSRTSDIELTLAIGVHGPQALHIVLVDAEV